MLLKHHAQSRYEILAKIASGGMATVYLGAQKGPFDFEHLVAIKRLHAHLLDDPSARESLITEARLAARIRHLNVVDVRDIDVTDEAIQLVMTYVEGASLGQLITTAPENGTKLPPSVAIRVVLDVCAGLHAAHELKDDAGKPLGLVHRDVSPQNVLVGVDGISRITDFGVARDESSNRLRTGTGTLKGKFAYMAPEYIRGQRPDRRIDVFALGVVLWESIAGRRLFKGSNDADSISRVTNMEVPQIGHIVPALGDGLDAVLEMALAKTPDARFCTTEALGAALAAVAMKANVIATPLEVGHYVRDVAHKELARIEEMRQTASRKRGSSDAAAMPEPVLSPVASTLRANGMTKATERKQNVTDDTTTVVRMQDATRVVPKGYETGVMNGTQESPTNGETPSILIYSAARTDDAPNSTSAQNPDHGEYVDSHAESQAGTDLPTSFDDPTLRSPMQRIRHRKKGPTGTAFMAPIPKKAQPVVIIQTPAPYDGPANALGADINQPLTPMVDPARSETGLDTLPVSLWRDDVMPFKPANPITKRMPKMRWFVAACVLCILSGIATTLLLAPRNGAHEGPKNALE